MDRNMRMMLTAVLLMQFGMAQALDYPYATAEPQKTGWPLTEEERAYVLKPEFERRPGSESKKHLPALWPVTPSAGNWGGTSWLDTHAKLVEYVKANRGPIDVLLVGDSLTQQWGSPLDTGALNAAWREHFGGYKTINLGIGGDKAQNVLWRLDHGGVDGLEPRLVVVMIGNNNMFFTPETGVAAAAKGIQMCVANLRDKFPAAEVIVVKILPAHAPGNRFYEDIKQTNLALDPLKLDGDAKVHVLDLTGDFLNADGPIKDALFKSDHIHLSLEGYGLYAQRLKPLVEKALGGRAPGGDVVLPAPKSSAPPPAPSSQPAPKTAAAAAPAAPDTLDGKSFLPLIKDPTAEGKPGTFCQWGNGRTVRTLRWRLVERRDGSSELYDHSNDPQEYHNVIANPEHASLVKRMRGMLEKEFGPMVKAGPGTGKAKQPKAD